MRILLAADGSEYTRKAAEFIASQPGWLREAPHMYVHTVHPHVPLPGAAAAVGKQHVEEYYRKDCEETLAVACKPLQAAGIKYEASYSVGEVAPEIRDFVTRNKIDLVIIGSHGHSALANVALGSVATKLIALLKIPILVVR